MSVKVQTSRSVLNAWICRSVRRCLLTGIKAPSKVFCLRSNGVGGGHGGRKGSHSRGFQWILALRLHAVGTASSDDSTRAI
jgi:hypothetical protein